MSLVTRISSPLLEAVTPASSPPSPYSFPSLSLADDVAALTSEYASMLPEISPVPSDDDISTAVDIRTKENMSVRMSVSLRGWTIDQINCNDPAIRSQCLEIVGMTYEDPEAALLRISPAFAKDWQNRLIEQLEMLAQ
ncbi:hypothetical protein V1512DRAFT_34195 [Lipomyces arxii]|uniref:uncharacterized protein n=1 Tax=Lipomyces arxii TaxID=56418 RepID=UPI0034CD93E4